MSITAKPIKELEDRILDFPTCQNTIKKRIKIEICLSLTSGLIKFLQFFLINFVLMHLLSTINAGDSKFRPSALIVPLPVFNWLYWKDVTSNRVLVCLCIFQRSKRLLHLIVNVTSELLYRLLHSIVACGCVRACVLANY